MSFVGSTCSVCSKVSVPPRVFCNICGCVTQTLSDLSQLADNSIAIARTTVVREPGTQSTVSKEFNLKKVSTSAYLITVTE